MVGLDKRVWALAREYKEAIDAKKRFGRKGQ